MEKKIARVFRKIRNAPGLSEHEKHLFARSLAASPDERWRLHENFLRSHGLFTRSARRKYGYRSKKFVGHPKDLAHLPLLKQTIALKRRAGTRN